MDQYSWLGANRHRYYPFIDRDREEYGESEDLYSSSLSEPPDRPELALLPKRLVADFGCVMDSTAEFTVGTDQVYLHSITRTNTNTYRLRFAYTGAGYSQPLDFTLDTTQDLVGQAHWALSGVSGDCSTAPWRGFVTLGEIAGLSDLLDVGGQELYTSDQWVLEPARIVSLANARVSSINLANRERLMSRPSDECASLSSLSEPGERGYIVAATCLAGDIKVVEGYNCAVEQLDAASTLIIGAAVGAGAGKPCDEIALYDGELPPGGSVYLSGGLGCGDVILTVAGLSGPDVRLNAGPGMRIFPSPTLDHTLVIARDLTDFAICPVDDFNSLSSS